MGWDRAFAAAATYAKPERSATSTVPSVDPVSTTTSSVSRPAALASARERLSSLSLTIRRTDRRGVAACSGSVKGPSQQVGDGRAREIRSAELHAELAARRRLGVDDDRVVARREVGDRDRRGRARRVVVARDRGVLRVAGAGEQVDDGVEVRLLGGGRDREGLDSPTPRLRCPTLGRKVSRCPSWS